jgi:hypothetical protein
MIMVNIVEGMNIVGVVNGGEKWIFVDMYRSFRATTPSATHSGQSFPQVFHRFSTGFPQVFHRFSTAFTVRSHPISARSIPLTPSTSGDQYNQ